LEPAPAAVSGTATVYFSSAAEHLNGLITVSLWRLERFVAAQAATLLFVVF
jgi:hypothetical protein